MRPVDESVQISFGYGRRYSNGKKHRGDDFSNGTEGGNVYAMWDGVVTHAGYGGWGPAFGQHVVIRSTFKGAVRWQCLAHLKTENVRVGQAVTGGQKVGTIGGARGRRYSGNSTGPHLHAQVSTQNRYDREIDPAPMIEAGKPAPTKPVEKYTDGMFWNLAASDKVYGKDSWDRRVPGIVKALKHYDRNIMQLVEAETSGEQGRTFAAALSKTGIKVAVADNQRMIAVKKPVKVGATKIHTLKDRGPSNDDKQIVMAVVTVPGTKPLVIESGHFEYRTGAAYDKTRANQAKETRAVTLAFAKANGVPENRVIFGNDENARVGTNAAFGTTFPSVRSRSNVTYGNEKFSTISGWNGSVKKSSAPYDPDKVRVHKDRPMVGASTSLTFADDKLSDHLPIVYTLGKV